MINLELFVYNIGFTTQSIYFAYRYTIVIASFVEKIYLFLFNSFCVFIKNKLGIFIWIYFWVPVLLTCISIFDHSHAVFITVLNSVLHHRSTSSPEIDGSFIELYPSISKLFYNSNIFVFLCKLFCTLVYFYKKTH